MIYNMLLYLQTACTSDYAPDALYKKAEISSNKAWGTFIEGSSCIYIIICIKEGRKIYV